MSSNRKRYWLTPPEVYNRLAREFNFNSFDPSPYPVPDGFDGLSMPWPDGITFCNPPFRKHDSLNGKDGPTAFVHKAISEHRKHGHGSVLVLPVQSYVMHLAAAGAEIRSMGRVRWLDVDSKEPMPGPSPICAFILRPF